MASLFDDTTYYDYDGPIVDIDGPLASGLIDPACLESMYPGSTAEVSRCPPSCTAKFVCCV